MRATRRQQSAHTTAAVGRGSTVSQAAQHGAQATLSKPSARRRSAAAAVMPRARNAQGMSDTGMRVALPHSRSRS